MVKTAIEGVFPLTEFFSEDGVSKIFESLASYVFSPNKKKFRNEFLDELGILNIVRQFFIINNTENVDKFIKYATNLKTHSEVLKQSKKNLIIQAINVIKLR